MRSYLVSFFGVCLLVLISGCGNSNKVEVPAKPDPLPKSAPVQATSSPSGGNAASSNSAPIPK